MLATDPRDGYHITVEEGWFSDGTKYYTAIAPELSDCLFQADTHAKAKEGLYDVISHLVHLILRQGKTPPRPVLARCTTAGVHQTIVTTGFSGAASLADPPSEVSIPHSMAPQTKIFRQEGQELLAI